MIVKGFNDALVFYQIPFEDQMANEAILIHRDNGGTLCIQQQENQLCLDLHRGNIKEFCAALNKAVTLSEEAARKAAKK